MAWHSGESYRQNIPCSRAARLTAGRPLAGPLRAPAQAGAHYRAAVRAVPQFRTLGSGRSCCRSTQILRGRSRLGRSIPHRELLEGAALGHAFPILLLRQGGTCPLPLLLVLAL